MAAAEYLAMRRSAAVTLSSIKENCDPKKLCKREFDLIYNRST
jgi:hypothetical protein